MEKKKAEQEQTFQEEVQRYIKQNRLQQRVKCSPALYSNGASLASKREEALDRARQQMNKFKSSYDQIKAQIEFNVANRPLLILVHLLLIIVVLVLLVDHLLLGIVVLLISCITHFLAAVFLHLNLAGLLRIDLRFVVLREVGGRSIKLIVVVGRDQKLPLLIR